MKPRTHLLLRWLVFSFGVLFCRAVQADDWPAARPFQFFSASGKYFIRFVPGDSIGDTVGFAGSRKGKFASALYYAQQADRSYKLLHEIALQNPVAPVDALLSDQGYFITLDNWHNLGYGKVAAIYGPAGKPIRSFELGELYPGQMLERIPSSVSSRHWRCQPSHFVEPKEQRSVVVAEALGGNFVFTLASGKMSYEAGTRKECVAPSGPLSQTRIGQ
ncbi:MAG: hypothetical protein EXR70_05345 [Deltaproteobacteria bacterium]|nr:hypothetical protein [Deltaproteobacteria bacterium]